MFHRAESSEYSYHVEEKAVLVKYSFCVSVTWTMQKRGRWECVRTCKTEQEARKEKTKVGVLEREGIPTR